MAEPIDQTKHFEAVEQQQQLALLTGVCWICGSGLEVAHLPHVDDWFEPEGVTGPYRVCPKCDKVSDEPLLAVAA